MEVPNDLRVRYLERRKIELEKCFSCLREKRFKELEKVGHQLKGNGETFGYKELSLIGSQIEKAAFQENVGHLKLVLSDFSRWLGTRLI